MKKQVTFDHLIESFHSVIDKFPDKRTGKNTKYTMRDIALGAFSVFFTQSPSFLAHQKLMQEERGESNAETLFDIKDIPSDNHIRTILDEVEPNLVFPVFDAALEALKENGHLDTYRSYGNNLLLALDATWYHSSKGINCDQCLTKKHKDGTTTFYHSAITPIIVSPTKDKVISLPPEFITPQDGHTKQDSETAAGKRWVEYAWPKYAPLGVTILGDDLYSRQPFCSLLLKRGFHFILVCKPDSHKTLYDWVDTLEPEKNKFTVIQRKKNGKSWDTYTYRYANNVPLRDTDDALRVNWCELTVTNARGDIRYKNAFATDYKISAKNVAQIVIDGRARWKIENENNNTLKTKGYNLEHNYGHGKKNLSFLLMTLNLLAFLFHTLLEIFDKNYRLLRQKLPTRKTFFEHIRALTCYLCFENWNRMLEFMLEGLKKKHRLKPR